MKTTDILLGIAGLIKILALISFIIAACMWFYYERSKGIFSPEVGLMYKYIFMFWVLFFLMPPYPSSQEKKYYKIHFLTKQEYDEGYKLQDGIHYHLDPKINTTGKFTLFGSFIFFGPPTEANKFIQIKGDTIIYNGENGARIQVKERI